MLPNSRRFGFACLTMATIVGMSVAWDAPQGEGALADGKESCQFAIRASNNLSFDVWVYLYDSKVRVKGTGIFDFWKQLKIQNHRIASGKTMDRRYTTGGPCEKGRQWNIKAKRGSSPIWLIVETGGTSSDSRTVDLGPSSRWVNFGEL